MKMHLPSTFILRYVRAKMIVHAFMIEFDQLDYWYPRFFSSSMYKVNEELFSCDITDPGIIPSREGDVQNLA